MLVGGVCREGLVNLDQHLITLGIQIFGPVKDDLRYLAGLILAAFSSLTARLFGITTKA